MANFPDSIYSPAAKSAGQTITAAFFNDPDGEITAIEQGYRNGTAPLNSSGSTVATLSVAGGSTFAVRPVMTPPDAARVFLQAVADLGSSAASTLSFLSQDVVINSSIHSTGTNPERLTPQSTGLYLFSAQLTLAGAPTAASAVRIDIRDSSAGIIGAQMLTSTSAAIINVTGFKRYDALGGYARVIPQNISGGSTLSFSTGNNLTWFSMVKL
jgi:hypothetical protein